MEKYITISEKDFNKLQAKAHALDLNKTTIDIYYNGFGIDRNITFDLTESEQIHEHTKTNIKECLRELKEFSDTLTEEDKNVLFYKIREQKEEYDYLETEHNNLIKEHEALKKVPKWILWFFKN